MKKFLIYLLVLSAFSTISFAQLYNSDATIDFNLNFHDMAVVNENIAFIACDSGIILRTVDGGDTWERAFQLESKKTIYTIEFLNEQIGIIGCKSGEIYKTTDGGNTWNNISNSEVTSSIYDVKILDENTYWFVGAKHNNIPLVMSTNDGGSTYTIYQVASVKKDAYSIEFTNNNQFIIVGYGGGIVMSPDGGTSWLPPNDIDYGDINYSRNDIKNIYAINDQTLIATGWGSFGLGLQNTIILKSIDGGINWTNQVQAENKATYCYGRTIYFKDENIGFIGGGGLGYGGLLLKTTDGGSTWEPIFNCSDDIRFVKYFNNKLYVGGDNYNLWVSEDMMNFTPISRPYGILYSIDFNGNKIAAAGWNSFYVFSDDLGNTFKFGLIKTEFIAPKINDVKFNDDGSKIWAGGALFATRYSTDNGATWTDAMSLIMNTKTYIDFVQVIDDNTLIIGGSLNDSKNDIILKSTDGGNTWDTISQGEIGNYWTCSDKKGSLIVIGGKKGYYKISTDNGNTWTTGTLESGKDINSVAISDDNKIYFACDDKVFVVSNDNGTTWTNIDIPYITSKENDLRCVALNQHMIIVNEYNSSGPDYQYISQDNGNSWTVDSLNGNKATYYDCVLTDNNIAFFASDKGKIIKKDYLTGIEEHIGFIKNTAITKNYPNPFNPSTTIEFTINKPAYISIEIYNNIGQKVETLIQKQYYNAGTFKTQWNASELPSGVYYYKLTIDNTNKVHKMTLIK